MRKQQFLNVIFHFTTQSVETIKNDKEKLIRTSQKTQREAVGKCPSCGGVVREEYLYFSCENWKKDCASVIWKQDKYLQTMKKREPKTMVKSLIKNNKAYVKGLTSKKGNKFNAYLSYHKDPERDYYSWKMEFANKR